MAIPMLKGRTVEVDENSLSIGEIFFQTLQKSDPERVVLTDYATKESLSLGRLFKETVALAKALQALKLAKGDLVALASENSLKYAIPFIAATYLGLPIAMISPSSTVTDYQHYFQLTEPKAIFTSSTCKEAVLKAAGKRTIIVLDGQQNETQDMLYLEKLLEQYIECKNLFLPAKLDSKEAAALVWFSSGTTGLPKAVVSTHDNIKASFQFCEAPDLVNLDSRVVTVALLPFYHTFGGLLLSSFILASAKAVIINKFTPQVFLQAIQEYKVNKLFVVPPLLVFLAKSPLVDQYDLSSLEEIICGAAPVGKDIQIILEQKLNNIKLRQIYGLTETGPLTVTPPEALPKYGSAGKLTYNTDLKIIEIDSGKPLGPNEQGEVCVKGRSIMKEYLKNQKETKQSFDGEGFLKTGDIGYYDEDGYLFIVDRLKELIKYKGFQVPPAQLEDLLLKYSGVKDCAVVGKPDERAGELPTAFIVKQKPEVSEAEIIDYVAGEMAYEKRLHGGVVFVEDIPKNPSGKILRRVLKQHFK